MCIRLRIPSVNKMLAAYRSQWKRTLMRFCSFGFYGRKGIGWWNDPEKAWYNFWYRFTTIDLMDLLGIKRKDRRFALLGAFVISLFLLPFDVVGAVSTNTVAIHREIKLKKKNSTQNKSDRNNKTGKVNKVKKYNTDEQPSTKNIPRSKNTRIKHSNSQLNSQKSNKRKISKPKQPHVDPTYEKVEDTKPKVEISHIDSLEEVSNPAPTYENKIIVCPIEIDKDAPKSKPKCEDDQYIRKRMIIADLCCGDNSILNKIGIGTYIDVSAEADNPNDKDAVILTFEREKIGSIAKEDRKPFATCLRLGRKIYGVITNISTENEKTKYEYEVWFDYS